MSDYWILPDPFTVRLTMLSDWHIGSGMGRPGSIDRLIVRDADDLPYVPAKTLNGIWRDACERLCYALAIGTRQGREQAQQAITDKGGHTSWTSWVDHIFGSQPALGPNDPSHRHGDPTKPPSGSRLELRAARIPMPLRKQLARGDRRLRQVLTFVKPGVKIDRHSGSAETDCLRFEETARKGMTLEASCRLLIDDPSERQLAAALLIASAQLVERLGGKRRRGSGRCRLEILGADVKATLAWLKRHVADKPAPPEWHDDSRAMLTALPAATTIDKNESPNGWVCVPLVLRLHGPVAVSYRTLGNVVETLNFVPGSFLLPHVTRTLPELRQGVPSGDVVVLPAYPEIDGERSQPVPLALFEPKDGRGFQEPEKIVNRLLQSEQNDGVQRKQLRDGYVSSRPRTLFRLVPEMHTHNTVHDESQRPSSEVGGVYTYAALPPRTDLGPLVLRSELRVRRSFAGRLDPDWWKKLGGPLALGRSKKDDYGAVELEVERPVEPALSPAGNCSPKSEEGSELFVWLVSDTLIRNERLNYEPTAQCLGDELSRRLGVRLIVRDGEAGAGDGRLHELVRVRRWDSWHTGWGLPRPSLTALQAGSCIVFRVEGVLDSARLAELELSGVGERTAEGFGQVRFNHPLITRPLAEICTHSPNDVEPSRVSSDRDSACTVHSLRESDAEFAHLIMRECWKQEIRLACLGIARDTEKRKTLLGWKTDGPQGMPPMSQLGGLRGQLALLRAKGDARRIIDWIKHLKENKRRSEKWPNMQKVLDFIEKDNLIWQAIDTKDWPIVAIGAQTPDEVRDGLRRELWPLAVRMFFDACIRAHKRELERHSTRKEAVHGA